ncbi:hypothetical protein EIN_442320 [Entamoeba invadens IP1]|uniref:Uncharacterized protein n=1 Tax=Entamoeba invadens IP1 TaxID=370355 RepID=A0A0A1UB26_ENTIV|nr:hypothetical protein EIN_442320 [Entamoeba invadens IP1]ELP92372.1 hypothetical protein EIN_442320 [Entamoeba invadens IP1]|eukprot:XP_004259143.1 hypothetical protein EIN_442320 [Entamoeba invadens IP1]
MTIKNPYSKSSVNGLMFLAQIEVLQHPDAKMATYKYYKHRADILTRLERMRIAPERREQLKEFVTNIENFLKEFSEKTIEMTDLIFFRHQREVHKLTAIVQNIKTYVDDSKQGVKENPRTFTFL